MLIVLIIIVQFTIQIGAWIYSTDSSVLDYISFTGTIVSIILALLAIIYAFVQSFTQQSSSQKIKAQVEHLIEVVSNIQSSENDLSKLLDQLKRIGRKVDSSLDRQDSIESSLEVIHDKFDEFDEEYFSDQTKIEKAENETTNFGNLLVSVASKSLMANIFLIYYGYKNGLSVNEAIDKYSKFFAENVIDIEDEERMTIHLEGSLIATFTFLNILQLAFYDNHDSVYDLDQDLISAIESYKKSLIKYGDQEQEDGIEFEDFNYLLVKKVEE